ncbi:hypothetical protein B0H13DRAFT_2096393 [Mycena leptocephala]|nr:hypothetical protein B0H13DRAFT_2096393 [Mycena leptocephala]
MPPRSTGENGQKGDLVHRQATTFENLPTEVLDSIFDISVNDRDESAASVLNRKVARAHLMATCKTFALVCRSMKSLWSNIVTFYATLKSVKNQLIWSGTHPLRILFDMPLTSSPDSNAAKIWETLKSGPIRRRWHSLYFVARRYCEPGYNCPHSLFAGTDLLLTAGKLRVLSLTSENPIQRCSVFHRPIPIDASRIESLTCWVPFERQLHVTPVNFLRPPLTHLTFLEIINEIDSSWLHLLSSCTGLKTLVWRSKRLAVVNGGWKTPLESLESLVLYNVRDLPPIVAPGITRLAIKDKDTEFSDSLFTEIYGSSAAAPSMRELDLLESPVSNAELALIMERCRGLTIFRLSSGNETRTQAYERLALRARYGYLNAPGNRLMEVEFSTAPPSNNRKAKAREHFEALASIGTVRGLTVDFDIDFYRLTVRTNLQNLNCSIKSADVRRIVEDNGLGSALIVVQHSKINGERYALFQLVLVLREKAIADRLFCNGLWVRNQFHRDVSMATFRSHKPN